MSDINVVSSQLRFERSVAAPSSHRGYIKGNIAGVCATSSLVHTMQLTTISKPCGIVVVSAVYDYVYLPLQSAEVHADVVDGEESPPISVIADSLICE